MTHRLSETSDPNLLDEPEARLARARLAFDQGLRDASETGARVAKRLLVPALWGAALVGGTLLAIAVWRLARRPHSAPALLRVSIEPRFQSRSRLPAIGSAVASFALRRLLEAPAATTAGASLTSTTPELPRPPTTYQHDRSSPGSSSNGGSSNGRANA